MHEIQQVLTVIMALVIVVFLCLTTEFAEALISIKESFRGYIKDWNRKRRA